MYNQIMQFTRPSTKVPFFGNSGPEAKHAIATLKKHEQRAPGYLGQTVRFSEDWLTMFVVTSWTTHFFYQLFTSTHRGLISALEALQLAYYEEVGGRVSKGHDYVK